MQTAQALQKAARHLKARIKGTHKKHALPGDDISKDEWMQVVDHHIGVLQDALEEMDSEQIALLIALLVFRGNRFNWRSWWFRMRVRLAIWRQRLVMRSFEPDPDGLIPLSVLRGWLDEDEF